MDAQSATGFGGQLRDVAFPRKTVADSETKKLECKDFKGIVERVNAGVPDGLFGETCEGMPGVGLIVRVAGLGSEGPEFKSHSAVELIPGGVDSACHPSEVGKMSASMLVYCVGVQDCAQ